MKSGKENVVARVLFRMFKRQMVVFTYSEPAGKKKLPDSVGFAFNGVNGHPYYRMIDDAKTPIARKLFIMNAFSKFVSGIDEQDITTSLQAIEKAINETDAKGKMKPNIARIGHICMQLSYRKGFVIRYDMLCDLAAHYFIRSDEAFEFIEEKILEEKKVEFRSGAYNSMLGEFFFSKDIATLFPYMKDIEAAMWEGAKETEAYITELKQYINGR